MFKTYPRSLFHAIRMVESGGEADPNTAVGRAGELGAYQISHMYYVDAIEYAPNLGGEFSDVTNPSYAEWIMVAYWDRHAPNVKLETLARIHNGGPSGLWSNATDVYWNKVRAVIADIEPGLIYADFNLRYRDECD